MHVQSVAENPTPREAPRLSGGGLFGHSSEFRDHPLEFLVRARQECGDVARMRLVHIPALVVSHPDAIAHVLVGNASNYAKRTRGYRTLRLILGNGLVTSEGELWRRQRRIAQPAFHKERIAGFAKSMSGAALDLATRLGEHADRGEPADVARAMNRLTLRIAGETLFSLDVSGESDAIGTGLDGVMKGFFAITAAPFPYPELWPLPSSIAFRRARRQLVSVVEGLVAERRRTGTDHPDLLGMFMTARDEETGEAMTDEQLRDEVLTMLLAGHETTSNALSWTLHLLGQHPDIAQQLETEVDAVLGGRLPEAADLRSLVFTGQVVKESMRLYPPVWAIARRAIADDVILGYRVPAGAFVFMSQYSMHRDPRYFPDPERFDPQRFGPDREPPSRFAYFPFSRGQRMCIGDRFAEMEAVLVLAVLVRRLRFAPAPGHPVVIEPTVTLRPLHGLPMLITRR